MKHNESSEGNGGETVYWGIPLPDFSQARTVNFPSLGQRSKKILNLIKAGLRKKEWGVSCQQMETDTQIDRDGDSRFPTQRWE